MIKIIVSLILITTIVSIGYIYWTDIRYTRIIKNINQFMNKRGNYLLIKVSDNYKRIGIVAVGNDDDSLISTFVPRKDPEFNWYIMDRGFDMPYEFFSFRYLATEDKNEAKCYLSRFNLDDSIPGSSMLARHFIKEIYKAIKKY